MKFWWLSFCDSSLPKGSQFLGACIVEVETATSTMAAAVKTAHALGCNPGGEVMGFEVPSTHEFRVERSLVGRVLSRAECDAIEKKWEPS